MFLFHLKNDFYYKNTFWSSNSLCRDIQRKTKNSIILIALDQEGNAFIFMEYYELNLYVFPKFICLNPSP